MHVHCGIMHNGQDMEATQMSTEKWTDKENVACTHNGILFCLKKKQGNYTICDNMDEPGGQYAKLNKPVPKSKYCMILLIGGI